MRLPSFLPQRNMFSTPVRPAAPKPNTDPAEGAGVAGAAAPPRARSAADAASVAEQPISFGAPELPEAPEAPASPAVVRDVLRALQPVNAFQAFALLLYGQNKAMELSGKVRVGSQQRSAEASLSAIRHTLEQIAGERKAAGLKLVGALGGAVVSYKVGSTGFGLRNDPAGDGGKRARGAGLEGTAQKAGDLVSGVVDSIDKAYGGTATADMARVAQREDDIVRNLAQQQADYARSSYDQADRAFQAALQAFSDYFRRKEALANAIASR